VDGTFFCFIEPSTVSLSANMPRQQTQQRAPQDRSAQKAPKHKSQQTKSRRGLDALSIAEKQIPTKLGVRRNRLGFYDDGTNYKKHSRRDEDDDEEEEEQPSWKRRRTDGDDLGSLDGGSDSDGHEWKLGQVDSDDDEELDSDEALGESDEERFEGFTFRGSSTTKSKPKPKKAVKQKKLTLSESEDESEEEAEEDEDEDDDELGEDAVDLLTAWDMNAAEEEEDAKKAAAKAKKAAAGDDSEQDSGSEGDSEEADSEDSDDDSDLSMSDDDDAKEDGLAKLQDFVNSMQTNKTTKKSGQKSQEQGKPSEYGLTSSHKLTVADLLPSITDSRLKSSLKHVDATAQASKSGIPGKLDAPLAKRQQDKIDRVAAYEKSKETLDRWLETVKNNRRADHLVFPLPDPDNEQVHRMDVAKPANDLESTIQNILVESGLAETNGKSAEEEIQGLEEVQGRTLPIEEIQARRAELRKRRDLLFREEVRAKRIKKIKSKSYRRVHRKEREKLEQQERQALLEAGVDLDEQERDENERKRAEARMSSKHRESKWAKSLKQTGRTAWDEDARNNANDLALREDELRKRIEGKSVSRGDEDYLGSSSSESEEEDPWAEDASDNEKRRMQKKLSALENDKIEDGDKGPHSGLFAMKFMQNADAARKEENDAELRRIHRELHGEESQSEAESEVGRRKFGQSKKADSKTKAKVLPKNEFEEAADSDAEPDSDVDILVDRPAKHKSGPSAQKPAPRSTTKPAAVQESPAEEENPWLVQTGRTNRQRTGADASEDIDISLNDPQPQAAQASSSSKKSKASKAPVKQRAPQNESDDEDSVPVLLKNHDLVQRAFAGDDVVQDFEQEKLDTIEDEGDKVVDETLAGWGSWAGDGISKRQQKKQKRVLTKVEGVKPEQRKDAKLSRVIINEKRVKKNAKYMASQLPHEFENKTQYERSLRMPLGPEWSTKQTFQSGTKPRVIVKQGVIKPMDKPMY
jgi:U3 small nucleolar RNA-associated protein 14